MKRFALFVDGSNLFGALKALNVEVQDYEKLYGYVFEQARGVWRQVARAGDSAPAELRRVYWYVVGSIDEGHVQSSGVRGPGIVTWQISGCG